MSARRLRTLVLAALAALAVAAPAGAMEPFPKTRISYHDRSAFKPAVTEAVRLWNAAGTRVRLKRARKPRRADIRIFNKRRILVAGRPVAGLGGGLDSNGRRERGWVKLSKSALGDAPERERVNVAAHELGHALGLAHLREGCSLMNEFPDSVLQSACPADAGEYRCGPQRADARALAKLYGGRARFPRDGGTCPLPAPPIEVLAPPPTLTLPSGGMARFVVRNGGSRAWDEFDYSAGLTDAAGNVAPGACSLDGVPMSSQMSESRVEPGGLATFEIMLCGTPGTTETFHLRLFDETTFPSVGVGPVRPVTVTFF